MAVIVCLLAAHSRKEEGQHQQQNIDEWRSSVSGIFSLRGSYAEHVKQDVELVAEEAIANRRDAEQEPYLPNYKRATEDATPSVSGITTATPCVCEI